MFARGKGEEHWDQVLKFPKQVKYLKEVPHISFLKGEVLELQNNLGKNEVLLF